ncbi:DUF416 family protein [Methylocaldum sp. RMAD-M]|jgi:uncharacterized protein YjaG (DUF416 family)|uniref:DUF416 family protein n=1 Tax=unclassified Methylocaldum TaxID=2622260 RepID=UPI0012EC0D3F|nr:DUF416 family protein [Methylocaldum sp. RMAD-M]MBP1153175.1 uncharacterized protein YjaG (DUF416 family) [Methylocaldum sp. RMAD-M]MVF25060.1 DUF416 family protein [Methylocaldum sp. BRCS4]
MTITAAFSESVLKTVLDQLSKEAKCAFAVSCAQRIFPCYAEYARVANRKPTDLSTYSEALSYVWDATKSRIIDPTVVNSLLERCMAVLPTEDDAWEVGVPYAEDAAATVVYCLRLLLTGDTQDAIWAARRVYEAVDNFVINAHKIDVSSQDGEKAVLNHPLVKNELMRQCRDLDEIVVASRATEAAFNEAVEILRERSKAESRCLFSE